MSALLVLSDFTNWKAVVEAELQVLLLLSVGLLLLVCFMFKGNKCFSKLRGPVKVYTRK